MAEKHFKAIAEIISKVRKDYSGMSDNNIMSAITDIELHLNDYFKMVNDNFNEDKFLTACK